MSKAYNEDSRLYITMLQSNIERMATNSRNCKAWMITIVTAFMALESAIQNINEWILLGILPVVLFWYLDSFYLSLERGMRNREQAFITAFNKGEDVSNLLFVFQPIKAKSDDIEKGIKETGGVWKTDSIFPFYLTPIVVLILLYIANEYCI